jgi:alpha-ribazole phosphatase/probable phosphoglycerate mutase
MVVSSPVRRCKEFAAFWAQQRALPLHVDSAWTEIAFGAWDGKTADQIDLQFPGALAAYYADPITNTPANGEPYQEFIFRIQQAWEQTITEFAGQRLLLVTHAGPIRALLSNLLMITPQNSFHIDVPHACLTRLSCFQHADNRFVQLNFIKPL